jgi:hypothetical protein
MDTKMTLATFLSLSIDAGHCANLTLYCSVHNFAGHSHLDAAHGGRAFMESWFAEVR